MPLATDIANDMTQRREIVIRLVGGLKKLDPFLSDGQIAALTTTAGLTALIKAAATTAANHYNDQEIARRIGEAYDAATDAGILGSAAATGTLDNTTLNAITTKAGLRTALIALDPIANPSLTNLDTYGDDWLS